MKHLITIALIIFLPIIAANLTAQQLIPFLDGNQYAYADSSGKVVLTHKYDGALPFYNNYELSLAIRNGRSFIINRKGKVIMKGSADYFQNDTCSAILKFFPEQSEPLAIREFCQQDTCPPFAIIEAHAGQKVFDKMNHLYFVGNNNKSYLIDSKGDKKTALYDKIKHFDFGEMEYCITEDYENKKFGLLNNQGETVLECAYEEIVYKGNGVFSLKQGRFNRDITLKTKSYQSNVNGTTENFPYKIKRRGNKTGVVDSTETEIIHFVYDKLYPLNENKFIFWKNKTVGIMDIAENYLFFYDQDFDYEEITNHASYAAYTIYGKNAAFFKQNNKWILINLNGQQIGNQYNGIFIDYLEITGLKAGVCIDSELGVLDENGRILLPVEYDQIYCLKEDSSFIVKKGLKWMWLNNSGKAIYQDFDNFRHTLKGFLYVLKGGKWYYVKSNGKEFKI